MLEQYNIRKAHLDEIQLLQKLMRRSLSTWNYTEKELDTLVEHLKITPKMFDKSIIYVALLNNKIKGFWCRELGKGQQLSQGRLYIDPTVIKTGVGTMLWNKMIADLQNRNIEYFTFLSDANAQEFYEKKGAIKIGEQSSVIITGKNIPIMRYYLK